MKNLKEPNEEKPKSKITSALNRLLDFLFPQNIKCLFCDEELRGNENYCICEDCFKNLPFITNACPRCSNPLSESNQGVCFSCKANNYEFKRAYAVFEYNETMLKFIHKLKYGGQKYLIEPMSNFLIDKLSTVTENFDYLTFVPMTAKKEKLRGYNQSKVLAECISKKSQIPLLPALVKIKDNDNQASLNYKERQENIKGVYQFNKEFKNEINGKTVLIIDDIITTGATSNEISKILLKAGAKDCHVLTLCHKGMDKITTEL